MAFKVIFSPEDEYTVVYEYDDPIEKILPRNMFKRRIKKTSALPKKGNVGLYILDLYRETTGDEQVSIDDIPPLVKNWRDDNYIAVEIDEETARASGKFRQYDTFYCKVELDLMKTFEILDILDPDSEECKLVISIDADKILEAWKTQEYPEELSSLKD